MGRHRCRVTQRKDSLRTASVAVMGVVAITDTFPVLVGEKMNLFKTSFHYCFVPLLTFATICTA
jgi:hypothetical protein